MSVYLNSFCPLCCTKAGREAVKTYKLHPYIDGSCRREPDFENELPVITGLCRPGFASKLNKGDIVVYKTNKRGVGSKKVVAILKVIQTFDNHRAAADWYIKNSRKIPNNLMVVETGPFPLDKTHKMFGWDSWIKAAKALEEWDKEYFERSNRKGNEKVAQCEIIFNGIIAPISLNDKDWNDISDRPLCAQNPPIITEKEWTKFKEKIKSTIVL